MDTTYAHLEAQAAPLNPGQAQKITDVLDVLVADAVIRYGRGQLVDYQVIAQAMPNPAEQGRWEPMALVFVSIASASGLDRRILNQSHELPLVSTWGQEQVDALVKELLDNCFATREAELTQPNGSERHHTTQAELVVPG